MGQGPNPMAKAKGTGQGPMTKAKGQGPRTKGRRARGQGHGPRPRAMVKSQGPRAPAKGQDQGLPGPGTKIGDGQQAPCLAKQGPRTLGQRPSPDSPPARQRIQPDRQTAT